MMKRIHLSNTKKLFDFPDHFKRGRGAAGKVPVFGLLKRGGRVYAKVIPDTKSHTLQSIIEQRVVPDSIVYADSYRS